MSDRDIAGGSRTVEPRKTHRSKRKRRASDARRLVARIETASALLRSDESDEHEVTQSLLGVLHEEKRAMRRDVYAQAPELEGRPVYRGIPGGRA